ncbi:MAG: hypothetical protein ACO3JL_17390 [Myxococcota bacterium]
MHTVLWWHFHQPDYREPGTESAGLPWVRMHALRAYTDLAALVLAEGLGGMTFNLVPSLCDQLEDLAEGRRQDRYLRLAKGLVQGDDRVIADAFRVHATPTPLAPRRLPRFEELQHRAREEPLAATAADAIDACVLFHLSWVGFTAVEEPLVQQLLHKGRDFTPTELDDILLLSQRYCREVLPRIRRAHEAGLVHLTATPYFHPILPLVIDSQCAREATWDRGAPPAFAYPGDAEAQVRLAVARHAELFGSAPKAMWPGEGSLSEAALDVFARAGVEVVATDEAMLRKSLGGSGAASTPPHLFPWRHERTGTRILFRDRRLSDDWGFVYRDLDPLDAVRGFSRGLADRSKAGAATTSVILDGEHPFERFPAAGREHLRALARAVQRGELRFSSPEEASAAAPHSLSRLATGSWIDASFDIWAGDDEDRRAWGLLARVRQLIEGTSLDEERRRAAQWHLLAAEGSDWFWWFGPEFHAEEQPSFDRIFRLHLREALLSAGLSPGLVPELAEPVRRPKAAPATACQLPYAEVDDEVNVTALWPWENALCRKAESNRGSMHRGAPLLLEVRALMSPRRLHLLARCREDVEQVEFHLESSAGSRRFQAAPVRAGTDVVARLSLPFEEVGLEPGEAGLLQVRGVHGELSATLPEEGDPSWLVRRPHAAWFEA